MAYDEIPPLKGPQMFQTIQGRVCFVVELKEFPITMPVNDGGDPALTPYAEALTTAINDGLVTGPGKYAIQVNHVLKWWTISRIIED